MEEDKFRQDIARRLSAVREHVGLQQGIMAKMLGISRANLYRMERGDTYPSGKVLKRLQMLFNVSLDWLIAGKGEMLCEPGGEKRYPAKSDFGDDFEEVKLMLELMARVPSLKYAVLNRFIDYRLKHKDLIRETLSEYERYKKKLDAGEEDSEDDSPSSI